MSPLGIIALVLALASALGGCSEIPWYQQGFAVAVGLHNQAVKDRQAFHDEQMKASLEVVCDNSVGAVGRLQDQISKDYILRHCGVAPVVNTGGPGSATWMGQ